MKIETKQLMLIIVALKKEKYHPTIFGTSICSCLNYSFHELFITLFSNEAS